MPSKKVYIIIGLLVVLAVVAVWAQSKQSNNTEAEVEVMTEE